jgi:hypothetical protein
MVQPESADLTEVPTWIAQFAEAAASEVLTCGRTDLDQGPDFEARVQSAEMVQDWLVAAPFALLGISSESRICPELAQALFRTRRTVEAEDFRS